MKNIIVTLFSLICVSAALAADVNMTGVWKVDSDTVGNVSSTLIPFKQEGTKLTGTMKSPEGQEMAITGKVEGKKVTWSYDTEWQGNPLTIVHVGTLDDTGTSITGASEVQPMGVEGSFVATKQDGAQKEGPKKDGK